MLIHAHRLNRVPQLDVTVAAPLLYPYDYLRPETWGSTERLLPCWSSRSDGLQFGMHWTQTQQRILRNYPGYKTYEIELTGRHNDEWVGIERSGYLLPEGFLPIRVTYRWFDTIDRMVLPSNIGYLYNKLLDLPEHGYTAIAPHLQFILDVNILLERPSEISKNYQYAQRLTTDIIKHGPHIARDIRDPETAYGNIRLMSQGLDVLGNAVPYSDYLMHDWIAEYGITEPLPQDTAIVNYHAKPIPVNNLEQWYTTSGIIDTSIPEILSTHGSNPIPANILRNILTIKATDLQITYAIISGKLSDTPNLCFIQNRFAAYFTTSCNGDIALVHNVLLQLTALVKDKLAGLCNVTFHMTCNDEVKIYFDDTVSYYTDLNAITDQWFGVSQSPTSPQCL